MVVLVLPVPMMTVLSYQAAILAAGPGPQMIPPSGIPVTPSVDVNQQTQTITHQMMNHQMKLSMDGVKLAPHSKMTTAPTSAAAIIANGLGLKLTLPYGTVHLLSADVKPVIKSLSQSLTKT